MSMNTSEEKKTRSFTTSVTTNYCGGAEALGDNVQRIDCLIKIVDKETGEPIRFDPKTLMLHPTGSRIQISGVISKDGSGEGMPKPGPIELTV